jgi:ring-1,2-phenylacetyl-CoA epoxidase subunit PaaE
MARFHELEVAEVRHETEDAVTVRFRLPDALRPEFAYRQGQHLILKATIDGEELRRTYSICSGVQEQELRICVKRQPGGRFSAFAHEVLKPGQRVLAMSPSGRFFTPLEAEAARSYVAFCAGSGITPIFSILKSVLALEPRSHFTLIYGSRDVASIIFREELEELKDRHLTRFALHHVLSREEQDLPILNGRIDAAKVRAFARAVVDPRAVDAFFLCGPAPMIGEAARALEELGVPRERIHFEYFTTLGNEPRPGLAPEAAPRDVPAAGACRVTAILDGRRSEFLMEREGPSILDAARAAGTDAPYACKAGVCSTCRARITEGAARMATNYALEDWEVEAGFVLTCQSHPLTDRLVVDYDAS